jgi:hypothetical protein
MTLSSAACSKHYMGFTFNGAMCAGELFDISRSIGYV